MKQKRYLNYKKVILLLLIIYFIFSIYSLIRLRIFLNHLSNSEVILSSEVALDNETNSSNDITLADNKNESRTNLVAQTTNSVTTSEITSRSSEVSRTEVKKETSNNNEWKTTTATAYCPCAICCGKTNGITASGKKATANHTIAASSKTYKLGTKIEIKGMGTYVVEDRGGSNIENKGYIDIFYNTHSEALAFGKKTINFRVIE